MKLRHLFFTLLFCLSAAPSLLAATSSCPTLEKGCTIEAKSGEHAISQLVPGCPGPECQVYQDDISDVHQVIELSPCQYGCPTRHCTPCGAATDAYGNKLVICCTQYPNGSYFCTRRICGKKPPVIR